jgi:hypothetical protein
MNQPFIRNHQYNFIKKQTGILQQACLTADRKVIDTVRGSAEAKILEMFPEAGESQIQELLRISALNTAEDFQEYLHSLETHVTEFPGLTENKIKKLFPKNKKLKIPDLSAIDCRFVTYLSWIDISANKLFLVYPLEGQLIGVEGRFTPANKKGVCCLCSRNKEIALFSAVCKSKPANASPDYYKAVGNYMCLDGGECNKDITDTASLEKLLLDIVG